MRAFLFASLLLASTASLAEPPVAPAITRVKFELDSRQPDWTASPIVAEKGDLIWVEVTGKVTVGLWVGSVGPNGAHNSDHHGRVDLKIGGQIQPVGEGSFLVAREGGPVLFRVNDSVHDDNRGSFTVVLTRIPAGAVPPPQLAQRQPGGR